jgi:hypothetical protein
MLRRADRALLMAKGKGRNCVVQLGSGLTEDRVVGTPKDSGWLFGAGPSKELLHQDLVTAAPMKITVAKLRGFIADHQAKVVAVNGNEVDLQIDDRQVSLLRRLTDRPVTYSMHLRFEEERVEVEEPEIRENGRFLRTRIHIAIGTHTRRDRRHRDVAKRVQQFLISFRSYMMADDEVREMPKGVITRVKRTLSPWLIKW